MAKLLSAAEMLEIISKQWATRSDMQKISGKCRQYSNRDFSELTTQIEQEGYRLPKNLVPMEKVVEYYRINIAYLKKISKINSN